MSKLSSLSISTELQSLKDLVPLQTSVTFLHPTWTVTYDLLPTLKICFYSEVTGGQQKPSPLQVSHIVTAKIKKEKYERNSK